MVEGDTLPLKDLCKICNIAAPKYCCPGCQTRTCSLTCYKRHQKWRQCSGKRDPAAYMARNQLATAAGIDHDYNFLTGIERRVGAVERSARDRGFDVDGSGPGSGSGPAPASNLGRRLAEAKITVHRAPTGMTRQRQNLTRWHPKHKCVQWTVEWFLPGGSDPEVYSCLEQATLADGYRHLMESMRSKRRKLQAGTATSKGAVHAASAEAVAPTTNSGKTRSSLEEQQPQQQQQAENQTGQQETPQHNADKTSNETLMPTGQTNFAAPEANTTSSENNKRAFEDIEPPSPWPLPQSQSHLQPQSEIYFYLVKPFTPSSARTLIPLDCSATLGQCLRNQTLLEFPTIQVLHQPPDPDNKNFIVEDDPLQTHDVTANAAGAGISGSQ